MKLPKSKKLQVNLFSYGIKKVKGSNGVPVAGSHWSPYNIFGTTGLDKIPVIYSDRTDKQQCPLFIKGGDTKTCSFQDLINKYNSLPGVAKIELPIYKNLDNLLAFLKWGRELKTNKGVHASSFAALHAPYNVYRHKYAHKDEQNKQNEYAFNDEGMHRRYHHHDEIREGADYYTESHYHDEQMNNVYMIIGFAIFMCTCCIIGGCLCLCGFSGGWFGAKLLARKSADIIKKQHQINDMESERVNV